MDVNVPVECLTCSVSAKHLHNISGGQVASAIPAAFMSSESMYSAGANLTSSHPRHFHGNSSCRYSEAKLSPGLDYYVHECLGPSIPYAEVRSLPANKLVKLLQINHRLRAEAVGKAFPRMIQLRVPLMVDATATWKRTKTDYVTVELYLPPGLKEDDTLIYPLIIWT